MRLIDADALIEKKFPDREISGYGEGTAYRCGWNDAIEAICENEPTIDAVEVKRGEWIHKPQIGWGETWVCSICGEKTTSSFIGKPRYEYCPMCGAKMDGEREGE